MGVRFAEKAFPSRSNQENGEGATRKREKPEKRRVEKSREE